MSEMPIYWKTTLKDVEDTLALVKKGKVSKVYDSAGGRPIYQLEYGTSNLKPGTAGCSSALGAHHPECYADKSGADYIPTVFLVGCVHGGEFEGTSALLNMIKMIETGTDYAGNKNDELVSLCERVHLIIIPMVNPDGRSHIPFDSFVGKTFYDLRYYNQGTWKDGSLTDWPGCKMKHPIKPYVDYLGGYFNDDGVNMMHEDFIGDNQSTGTKAVLDVCRKEAPDFSILLHGGDNGGFHIIPPAYASLKSKNESYQLSSTLNEIYKGEGLLYHLLSVSGQETKEPATSFNLPSAMHHCCSEPAVTFESNQGLCDRGNYICTYEEIYKAHTILFAETIKQVLAKYGKL